MRGRRACRMDRVGARRPAFPGRARSPMATADWAEPAGGGAVIAAQLAKLAGACDFFTALGDDELGHRSLERLAGLGIDVHAGMVRHDAARVRASRRARRAHDHDGRAEAPAARTCRRWTATTPSSSSPAKPERPPCRPRGAVRCRDSTGAADAARGRRPARPARRQRHRPGRALRRWARRRPRRPDRGRASAASRPGAASSRRPCPGRSPTPTGRGIRSAPRSASRLPAATTSTPRSTLAARAGAAVITGKGPFAAQISTQGVAEDSAERSNPPFEALTTGLCGLKWGKVADAPRRT